MLLNSYHNNMLFVINILTHANIPTLISEHVFEDQDLYDVNQGLSDTKQQHSNTSFRHHSIEQSVDSNPSTSHSDQDSFNTNMYQINHPVNRNMPPYRIGDHVLVKNAGNRYKPCAYCVSQKIKTKSGWYVNTYYQCEVCGVPLCKPTARSNRNCFYSYHGDF